MPAGKLSDYFFFYLGFLGMNIRNTYYSRRRGSPILTPPYHFDPFHKHWNISLMVTTEISICSQLVSGHEPRTVSDCISVTTRLRDLEFLSISSWCHSLIWIFEVIKTQFLPTWRLYYTCISSSGSFVSK